MQPRDRRTFCLVLALGALGTPRLAIAQARPDSPPLGQARPVGSFDAVMVRGPVDVVLREGRAPGVWVQAGEADPALIETRVVRQGGGSTLEIEFKTPAWHRSRTSPKVEVRWAQLTGVALQGSGDLLVDGATTPSLAVRVQGSGTARLLGIDTPALSLALAGTGGITAKGRSSSLVVSLAGSGDIEAAGLEAEAVTVSIAGSGDVEVHATRTLQAQVAGSGDLRYRGAAQVQSRVAGSGRIDKF